ncbi:unnamed protein product [Strongylus vulgaris]|uniref:Uncharacterized protein n=1 Tax=Strongylus vulgaris TaxID=40348 RepID=A0A3P7I987_STRVU|nr:unnamed protein product [Strongylus vulgaris]
MEPRLAAGRQATEQRAEMNLPNVGSKTTESAVALADQLVLEFLVMELTEPQVAQLAKTAGDGYVIAVCSWIPAYNNILEHNFSLSAPCLIGIRFWNAWLL